MERVKSIVSTLHVPSYLVSMLEPPPEGYAKEHERGQWHPGGVRCDAWMDRLAHTSRCLLSLARALIANPELMCIHKPTMPYDEKLSYTVLDVLLQFVREKGLAQDLTKRHLRRPRTCIMTSSKLLFVNHADAVYHVSRRHGIRLIKDKDCVA